MKERVITSGKIINLANNREYRLSGVKERNGLIYAGRGYCVVIREYKEQPPVYILTMVTEESYKGSVANKPVQIPEVTLKDFYYIGREDI